MREEERRKSSTMEYSELDDEELEVVVLGDYKADNINLNQTNNNPGADLKKPFMAGSEGHFPRNLEMRAGSGVRIKGKKMFF